MRLPWSLFVVSLIALPVEAGVVVHVEAKDLSTGKSSERSVYYAQDGMLRVDTLDDRGHVTRMSLVRDGIIWEVNVEQRTFTKIDKATMQQKMAAVNAQLQAALAQVPPERRAMMEERMKQMQQHPATDLTWTDAGRNEKSTSYSCHVWEEKRAGKVRAEYCVAEPGSVPGGDELAAAMRQAAKTAQDIFAAVPQMATAADHFSRYSKMNGFPVLKRDLSGGKPSREEYAKTIERQALPADKFAIPKGFTETSLTDKSGGTEN